MARPQDGPCLVDGSDRNPEFPQSFDGCVEGLVALAEAEADVVASEILVPEEARPGDGRHAYIADEVAGERDVGGRAEGPDAGHDVVRTVGRDQVEADRDEGRAEP